MGEPIGGSQREDPNGRTPAGDRQRGGSQRGGPQREDLSGRGTGNWIPVLLLGAAGKASAILWIPRDAAAGNDVRWYASMAW